jgi:hypothetical protein
MLLGWNLFQRECVRSESVASRKFSVGALLVLMAVVLGGCLANTPTNVCKRFVNALKDLDWDRMEKTVDWPASEQALGKPLETGRKEVLLKAAEGIGAYPISYEGESKAKQHFIYFHVTKTETLERTDTSARLRITLRLRSDYSKAFEMSTVKVGRTWKVVLTPELLKEDYIEY